MANGTAGTTSPYGSGALATRLSGGTAGVTNQGGHSVFTSSVAPAKAHAAHRSHARSAVHATAPSPRTATGNVWSGFAAPARSPVSTAAAYAAGQGGTGTSTQLLAGMLILGVGLTGLLGGAVAVTVSSRRKAARARATDNS